MQELRLRRGGLAVMIACVVVVSFSGGYDLSLGVFVPIICYVALFGTPQFLLAHLFTGGPISNDQPWTAITLWAMALGLAGSFVLWVLVFHQVRNRAPRERPQTRGLRVTRVD